jgi:hypothetical protein
MYGGIFMEIIRKNIHMNRIRTEAVSQFTLEDDMNIPENRPDVNMLSLEKGSIVIEEVKPGTDVVLVKGVLDFNILYHTNEDGGSLTALEGKIHFDEKINMQGVLPSDNVEVEGSTEDLTVELINSRKLSIRVIATLAAKVEELYDEEAPIAVAGPEEVEYRKIPMSLTEIAICKNDIFRIREEAGLPASYPNIFSILWTNATLRDVEFKIMEEKLAVQGDIHLCVLYEGEGDDHPVSSFETMLPFSGVLECHGCREGMIPDISYKIGQQDIEVRPDFDGEERTIGIEIVLDMAIKVYEEEETEIISDIYGVTKNVESVTKEVSLRTFMSKVTGKTKVTEHIKIPAGKSGILQLLYSEGKMSVDKTETVENGVQIQGGLEVKVMYITGDDAEPYNILKAVLPYQYTMDTTGAGEITPDKITGEVEQLQVSMLDGEEVDVKAVLMFHTTLFQSRQADMIKDIKISEPDTESRAGLPGMIIYFVKDGDNLWNIGKKFYVPVDKLRTVNNLESDELKKGMKLLVVR